MNLSPLPTPAVSSKGPVQRALAVGLAGFVLLLACSRQAEGDRCSTENDDNDCESGLICVPADDLRGGQEDGVSRCCQPEGNNVNDGRCTRLIGAGTNTTTSSSTTTSSNTTGGGGQAGESGVSTNTTGASCTHTSQCPEGMVCGPLGTCQDECLEDRDCDAPLVCQGGRCVDG